MVNFVIPLVAVGIALVVWGLVKHTKASRTGLWVGVAMILIFAALTLVDRLAGC